MMVLRWGHISTMSWAKKGTFYIVNIVAMHRAQFTLKSLSDQAGFCLKKFEFELEPIAKSFAIMQNSKFLLK